MYSYIQQNLQVLAWISLGVAGVTSLQIDSSLISESRVGNGGITLASEPASYKREITPIEPIRRIEINTYSLS